MRYLDQEYFQGQVFAIILQLQKEQFGE